MNVRTSPHLQRRALLTALATVAVTSAHHIYRLGPQMVMPAVAMLVLLSVLMLVYNRSGRTTALWAYTAVNALIFVWFGLIDGFLDHVLKALGLENVTILPGGDAEVVETAFSLWSPAAGNLFYELTGILTFGLGVVALAFNLLLVQNAVTRKQDPTSIAARPHVKIGG
jgi:hypothetical protein